MLRIVGSPDYRKYDDAIALLVDEADSPDFERHYLNVLRRVVSFDLAMIAIYDGDHIRSPIGGNLPYSVGDHVLETYGKRTYGYSPFYQRHRRGLASGVYFMTELARSGRLRKPTRNLDVLEIDDREEVGYATVGWPRRLTELDIAIRLSSTQTAQVALYRTGGARFNPGEIDGLLGMRNTLIAIYGRFWRERQKRASPASDTLDGALRHLATGALSRREFETLRLVAEGLSAEAIAARLGVGRETVKTHKKRAYQKLGIGSRTDLFARLLACPRQPTD
jgi:DNA-binding CsgD family transcriptional regulator